MNILIEYSYYPSFHTNVKQDVENWTSRLNCASFEVDTIPITLHPPFNAIPWTLLDKKWKLGDKYLLNLYEDLAIKLSKYPKFK
ncbi:MAG: hypothetical protein HY738_03520 [Bacteroidia bacterium]|nr:hypothetical protein [Bacteroidia bacterium]